MNTSYLRLNKTVGENASDPRAWLAFALEASGASRWEIALPTDSFSLTELWQRLTGDDSVTAIPRADLVRLRAPLAALLAGERAEIVFEFVHPGRDGSPTHKRCVIRLAAADPATGRPRRLRGLNFRLPSLAADGHGEGRDTGRESALRREIDAYCHAVGHEMRAPARAIADLADRLLDRHGPALPEDARLVASRIALASRDLQATLEGIEGLARLAHQELVLGRLDLADLAREAWISLRPGDAPHAARLRIAAAGAPPVQVDRALAFTLVRHLLANAHKFTRGKPDSPVTFAWTPGPPPHFTVRDHGVGFDLGAARRLFEPFGRQHPAAQFDGPGIGLAIVRRIAERHGGRVWVETAPERGAAFHFTLPAA